MNNLPILIVDDDNEHRFMLKTVLRDWGYKTEEAKDGLEAVEFVNSKRVSLILMDVRMGRLDGISSLEKIKQQSLTKAPIIIMTAYSKVEDAVEALKLGAYDYIIKPLDLDLLKINLQRAFEHQNLKKEKENALWGKWANDDLIGESPAFKNVLDLISLAAPSEATILITGESGVGKEVVAKALQKNSNRAQKPFVTINCAALAETLLEAELFGHEKGAFTGAEKQRDGRLKAAEGGTVFLDEIAETSPSTQAKLLRALQEGEIQPVGSDKTEKINVRFLAATNRDLEQEIKKGNFREDLFWRLNVVNIKVPPLRERKEDITPLASLFIRQYALKNNKEVKGISPQALNKINNYKWPGNIRELQNAIERAVILMRGPYVTEKDLPLNLTNPSANNNIETLPLNLEEWEKIAIVNALNHSEGNKTQASKALGITRKTLSTKLKKYELE